MLAFAIATDSQGAHLPLALLLVFGVAKFAGELCERFGQPGMVGEIIAGVILGPSVLNLVQPDQVLGALSEVGVMFLLFRVGLEVKSSTLLKVGPTALLVAVAGVILPFVLGSFAMNAVGASRTESFFVAAALVATSVGITAQVLASRGLLDQRASQVILAAAVIDDVLGLLVLALVSSMAEGRVNVGGLITTSVLAIAFTLLVAKFGTRTMRHVIPRVERQLRSGEVQFNLALLVLFGLSVLAASVGIAVIVGAFLAGMALGESVNSRVHDMAQGITEMLLPFFLAGIGLHLNLQVFADRSTVFLVILIVAIAVLSKMLGCGLAAYKLGRVDMIRIGVGMIPRGEVGMVVAQLGLGMGAITKPVYAVVVAMAVLTTLIAPPLLKYAYRGCVPGPTKEEFTLA